MEKLLARKVNDFFRTIQKNFRGKFEFLMSYHATMTYSPLIRRQWVEILVKLLAFADGSRFTTYFRTR